MAERRMMSDMAMGVNLKREKVCLTSGYRRATEPKEHP